jgi:hypothetical protein
MSDSTDEPVVDQEPVTTPPTDEPEWISSVSVGHPVLDGLIRSNGRRIDRLGAGGVGVDLTRLMIMALIEDLYAEGEDRQRFEMAFQTKLAQVLTQIEAQASQQRLAQGGGGLIVPGS